MQNLASQFPAIATATHRGRKLSSDPRSPSRQAPHRISGTIASARSPVKSQKKGNGVRAPHSSPMNRSGICGERSRRAIAARAGCRSQL